MFSFGIIRYKEMRENKPIEALELLFMEVKGKDCAESGGGGTGWSPVSLALRERPGGDLQYHVHPEDLGPGPAVRG